MIESGTIKLTRLPHFGEAQFHLRMSDEPQIIGLYMSDALEEISWL